MLTYEYDFQLPIIKKSKHHTFPLTYQKISAKKDQIIYQSKTKAKEDNSIFKKFI